jgi:uncharacterized protein
MRACGETALIDLVLPYLPALAALIAAGAVAGLAAGLFGIGGGAIIVPVLSALLESLGFSETAQHVAVSTSLATIILTSMRSVQAHAKEGVVDFDLIRAWSPYIVLGALIGMALAGVMSKSGLRIAFGVIGLAAAAQLFFGRPDWHLAKDMPKGLARAGLGTSVGTLSALMGIGGGTFGVTLMTLCGRPVHRAVATASGWGVAIGVPGALAAILVGWGKDGLPPLSLGYVNGPAFLVLSVFTVWLAPVGARLAHRTDAARLKRLFGVVLGVIAVRMLWQAVS